MRARIRPIAMIALLGTLGALATARSSAAQSAQADELAALAGEWLYVEDRTEGRPAEEQQPPMSVIFALRIEEDAVVMERGTGAARREERIALDGSTSEDVGESTRDRRRGEWKDGVLIYETEIRRRSDGAQLALIRREFRATPEGLLVRVVLGDPATMDSVAFYRHPQDIELPAPAAATVTDVAWIAGAWVGTRGKEGATSIEERWTPPLGGAMLGVSRTVSRDRMRAFEYLRIVERDGGLVYVAQPNGASPTEFVLTELGPGRAVFENPRHDSPQRIVYERTAERGLVASIGFARGGRPQRFEFRREGRQDE